MPRVIITVTAGSQTRAIIGTISAVGGVPPYEFTPQDAPPVAEVKPIYPSRLRALGIKTNGELHLTGNNFRFGGLHTLHPVTVKDNSQPPNTLTTRFVLSVAPGFQVSAFYSPSGDGGRVTISLRYANAAAGRNVSATLLGYAPADLSVSGDVNLNNARGSLLVGYHAATLAQITVRATESGAGGRVASRVLQVFTRRALTLADWHWGAGLIQVSLMSGDAPRATATVLATVELVGIAATVNEFGFRVQTRDPGSDAEFNVITATINTTTQTTTTLYTSDNFPYNTVTVERVAADISRALQLIAPRARQSYPGLRLHIWQFGAENAAISSRLFSVRTEVGNAPLQVSFTHNNVILRRTSNDFGHRPGNFLTRFTWSGGVDGGRVEFKRGRRWHFGFGKIRVPGYEWLDINANGEIRVGDKTQLPCARYDNPLAPAPTCITPFTGPRTIIMRYTDGANNTSEARMTITIQP